MKLRELCEKIEYTCLQGSMDVEIADIIYDSRKLEQGTAFVCMTGRRPTDTNISRMRCEKSVGDRSGKEVDPGGGPAEITVVSVASARKALACMSAAYFGYPARELTTIGLTGTKGKTTTTYMIKSVLEHAGKKVGLIGTIGSLAGR